MNKKSRAFIAMLLIWLFGIIIANIMTFFAPSFDTTGETQVLVSIGSIIVGMIVMLILYPKQDTD